MDSSQYCFDDFPNVEPSTDPVDEEIFNKIQTSNISSSIQEKLDEIVALLSTSTGLDAELVNFEVVLSTPKTTFLRARKACVWVQVVKKGGKSCWIKKCN